MPPNKTIQTELLKHSKAKVELYSTYLESYLAVLTNTQYVDTINIFDLFCGEGLYKNNEQGSPLAGLKTATNLLQKGTRHNPTINFYFNDNGQSTFNTDTSKVERLKKIVEEQDYDPRIKINYQEDNFSSALYKSYELIAYNKNAKSLYFIDPYGYKDVPPDCIKEILSHSGTELILFLPASTMYRFANNAETPQKGHEALHKFLKHLFPEGYPDIQDVNAFIRQCKINFQKYLEGYFVDTFTLQRDKQNKYCLFFFTSNSLGFEKMLEVKWKMDEEFGEGFRLGSQVFLTGMGKTSQYPAMLQKELFHKEDGLTNAELYQFGLDNGFLPKHTKQALDSLKKKITIESLDGKPVKGYYISHKNTSTNPERRVLIRVKK